MAPFQSEPVMRFDFDDFAAVSDASVRHQNLPGRTRFPFGFLSCIAPELFREFRFGERLPQFLRCRENVGYINELTFFHHVIFSWFWFVRDLFSDRSTLEGDGVRIC